MLKITIELDDETLAMLHELANEYKLSAHNMVIHLIHLKFIENNFEDSDTVPEEI